MNDVLRRLPVIALLLFSKSRVTAESQKVSVHQFRTAEYRIELRVNFSAPYEGKRLVLYRGADSGRALCLNRQVGSPGCVDNFVGSLALVVFTVKRIADGKPAPVCIREVVTVMDQSPGMPDRPPFITTIKLVDGLGSDIQVFGYDEGSLPAEERAAERQAARAAWRRYRQKLYINEDQRPFAVIEWLHSTTHIRILRMADAESPSPEAIGSWPNPNTRESRLDLRHVAGPGRYPARDGESVISQNRGMPCRNCAAVACSGCGEASASAIVAQFEPAADVY
jgi:hypothetical protein